MTAAPRAPGWVFVLLALELGEALEGYAAAAPVPSAAAVLSPTQPRGMEVMRAVLADPDAPAAVIAALTGVGVPYAAQARRIARVLPWLAPQVAAGDYPMCIATQLARRQDDTGDVTPAVARAWWPPLPPGELARAA